MKNLVRIACFICCVGFNVSARPNNATPVNPWDIKEVSTFQTVLHKISAQDYDGKNCEVLFDAWAKLETAFNELQNASVPAESASEYAVFVNSIRVALNQYQKAKETGNCANLKAAFEAMEETFADAVTKLSKMLN